MITTDPKARKDAPLHSGCFQYFPKALRTLASRIVREDDCTPAESLTRLLLGEAIEKRCIQSRAEQIALNAIEALQEEITGVVLAYPFEGSAHAFCKRYAEALLDVANLSRVGSNQHNPGKPLFWDRSKSADELDALARHLVEAGKIDVDGVRHSTKVAWRALANLEKSIEAAERMRTPGPGFLLEDHPCWDDATRARVEAWGAKSTPTPTDDPDVIVLPGRLRMRMVACTREHVRFDRPGSGWSLDPRTWWHSHDQAPKLLAFHERTYKLKPGEYRDPCTGMIKDLAADEVRLSDGSVVKLQHYVDEDGCYPRRVHIGFGTCLWWDPAASSLDNRGRFVPADQLPRVCAFYLSYQAPSVDHA